MKSNLNDKQKEAVSLGLGPALILAGPGSGKTTVILERIKHLIYGLNISPQNILVITFTKSAALEMQTRAAKILNHSEESPFFGTFHSYFYSILKRSYEYHNFSIMTTKQKYQNLENLLKLHFPSMRISNNLLMDILTLFSKQKNGVTCLKEVENSGFSKEQFENLRRTFDHFNREQKLMDYDDIILLAFELLRDNPGILAMLQSKVRYILIDEFQDVNRTQYELISLLAGKNGNLFVVGDDDQSIYRFRGAGEENLRQFETDFPLAKKVVLDINYRCPQEVVKLSSKLIEHNTMRFQKKLSSGKNEAGKVSCKRFISKEEERRYIAEMIKTIVSTVTTMEPCDKKIAILCRTNSQLSYFAEMLKKEKIPYFMKEKTVKFYELPHIRPIIGYLMFASGVDRSRKKLFTFLNQPMRYINRELFVGWDEGERKLNTLTIKEAAVEKELVQLDKALQRIEKMSPQTALTYILKGIDYEIFYLKKCKTIEEIQRFKKDMEELKERANMYTSIREWMHYVLWEEEKEEDSYMKTSDATDTCVFLYTFHGAKGLEFDTVFIPHLNEGSVPYGKNLSEAELEEERRMFYVALTRCSGDLYLTFVENDTKKDTVSRFIKECAFTVSK